MDIKVVESQPVQSNLCTLQLALSTAVANKVTETFVPAHHRRSTLTVLSPARPPKDRMAIMSSSRGSNCGSNLDDAGLGLGLVTAAFTTLGAGACPEGGGGGAKGAAGAAEAAGGGGRGAGGGGVGPVSYTHLTLPTKVNV